MYSSEKRNTLFHSKPAFILTLSVITGTVISMLYDLNQYNLYALIASFILVVSALAFKKFFSITFIVSGFLIGIYLSGSIGNTRFNYPDKTIGEMRAVFKGEITKISRRADNYIKFYANGTLDLKQTEPINSTKVFFKMYGDSLELSELNSGTLFLANVRVKIPSDAYLEKDFDEKLFSYTNGVDFWGRARLKEFAILSYPSGFHELRNQILSSVHSKIDMLYSAKNAPIVKALVTGDRSMLDPGMTQEFSLVGTAHVLAVSGIHVGIIASLAFFLTAFIRNRYIKFLVFSALVVAFVIFSGLQPSAIRAGGMAILFVLILLMQRKADILNILSFVVLVAILAEPDILLSTGFQMSVFAVAMILILTNQIYLIIFKIIPGNNFLSKFTTGSISVSMAATIGISPLMAIYFGHLSLYSPLANFVVVPAFSLAMVFSVIGIIASYLSIFIAQLYALSAELLFDISIFFNKLVLSLPYSYVKGDAVILYSILFVALMTYSFISKRLPRFMMRFSVSIFILLVSFYLLGEKDSKFYGVLSREDFVAVILPESEDKDLILVADRRPAQYPLIDFGILWRMWNSEKQIDYYYAGNCAMAMHDIVKGWNKIDGKEANLLMLDFLKNELDLEEELPQITKTIRYDRHTGKLDL